MKKNLVYYAAVEVNDCIYFASNVVNGICCMNCMFKQDNRTGEIVYLGTISKNSSFVHYCKAILYKNQIFFIPSWGDNTSIVKLNLEDNIISSIAIPPTVRNCSTVKFIDAVIDGKNAWLIPAGYDALLYLDMESGEIESYEKWPDGVQWRHEKFVMFKAGIQISDLLCLCPCEGEFFITFDVKTKEMKAWEWKYPDKAFCGMIYHREHIWFLPRKEYPYIVKYSFRSGEVKYIKTEEPGEISWYGKAVLIGDTIICSPYEAKHWLYINTVTEEVKKVPFADSRLEEEYPYYQFAIDLKDGVKFIGNNSTKGHFISNILEVSEVTGCDIKELDLFFSTVFHQQIMREKSEEECGKQIFEVLRG